MGRFLTGSMLPCQIRATTTLMRSTPARYRAQPARTVLIRSHRTHPASVLWKMEIHSSFLGPEWWFLLCFASVLGRLRRESGNQDAALLPPCRRRRRVSLSIPHLSPAPSSSWMPLGVSRQPDADLDAPIQLLLHCNIRFRLRDCGVPL